MSGNMSVIKDRTLEDVNRAKELLSKKYQNMTQAEKDEWDGVMKGRFTYQDMNRVSLNLAKANTIYALGRQGRGYTSSISMPSIKLNWEITDAPTSTDFQNLVEYLNILLTEAHYPTITFDKYDYINFNKLEANTEILDNYTILEDSNGNETTINLGYNQKSIKVQNYILTNDNRNKVTFNCPLTNLDGSYANLYNTKVVDFSKVGYFWNVDENNTANSMVGAISFTGSTVIEKIILPEHASFNLYADAFKGCTNLKEINPKHTLYLGNNAFAYCSSLENIELIKIPSIGSGGGQFYRCTALKSLKVTGGSTGITIPTGFIQSCPNIEEIIIGGNINEIKNYAFVSIGNLDTLTYIDTMAHWNAITKGSNWYTYSNIRKVQCTDGTITL